MRCYRSLLGASLVGLVPLGYWVRFLTGLPNWLSDALGSVAYEMFWIGLVALLVPRVSLRAIAVGVLLATCAIEILQLWQPPFLQALRATLPGRLVLGNAFSWWDFPAYFVGSWVGWRWTRSLWRWSQRSHS